MTRTAGHLGKKPATVDKRDLLFKDFRATAAKTYPVAPIGFGLKHVSLISGSLTMMGNGPDDDGSIPAEWTAAKQGAGDCVIADAGNRVRYSNLLAGKTVKVTGKECIQVYADLTGYDPVTRTYR